MDDPFIPKDKLPVPPAKALGWRFITYTNDWYVQTTGGWFWFDSRAREWKLAPMGPPH